MCRRNKNIKLLYNKYRKAIKIASDKYIDYKRNKNKYKGVDIWSTGRRARYRHVSILYGNFTHMQLLKDTLLAANSNESLQIDPIIKNWYDWIPNNKPNAKRNRRKKKYKGSKTFKILLNVNLFPQSCIRHILNSNPGFTNSYYMGYARYVYFKFGIIPSLNNFVKYDCHISTKGMNKYFLKPKQLGRRRLELCKIFLN